MIAKTLFLVKIIHRICRSECRTAAAEGRRHLGKSSRRRPRKGDGSRRRAGRLAPAESGGTGRLPGRQGGGTGESTRPDEVQRLCLSTANRYIYRTIRG